MLDPISVYGQCVHSSMYSYISMHQCTVGCYQEGCGLCVGWIVLRNIFFWNQGQRYKYFRDMKWLVLSNSVFLSLSLCVNMIQQHYTVVHSNNHPQGCSSLPSMYFLSIFLLISASDYWLKLLPIRLYKKLPQKLPHGIICFAESFVLVQMLCDALWINFSCLKCAIQTSLPWIQI